MADPHSKEKKEKEPSRAPLLPPRLADRAMASMKKELQARVGAGTEAFVAGTVIGVAVDFEAGVVWWRVGDAEPLQPFPTLTALDGLHPAVSVASRGHAVVNLGRSPFRYPLPEGYFPVEDLR